MRKQFMILLLSSIVLILAIGFGFLISRKNMDDLPKKDTVRIGVSLYRSDDTFIAGIKKEMETYADEYEKKHNIKINLEIIDAGGSQIIQNKQIDRFISLGYDVLCINPVERTDASTAIDKVMSAGLPLVFFNRKPVEDDMNRARNLYYVGTNPKVSALLEGKILVDAYQKDPSSLDLDGDGKVSYLLLEGEPSHQDSLVRTKWSVKALSDGGVPIKKLAGGVANWERGQASALMERWIDEYGDKIELILSNNDDMALGAIDALQQAGVNRAVKVVGIDGTEPAIEAIGSGKLFGTVSNNKREYGKVLVEIAVATARGEMIPPEIEKKMPEGKYYDTEQYMVTKDSYLNHEE